jgi:hypothetical protein
MTKSRAQRPVRGHRVLHAMLVCLLLLSTAHAALAQVDEPEAPTAFYVGSDNERAGFGVTTDIRNYAVGQLNGGWYLKWGSQINPPRPDGYYYLPMLIVHGETFFPNGGELDQAINGNRGGIWLVGNEPDNIYQDGRYTTPQQYVTAYHNAYAYIKQRDPTAKIAVGGMTQATPLRLQWLDIVWNTYQSRYGTTMPVDVWNIHTFVLREQRGSWGASIPPGVNANSGMLWEIQDHDRIDLVRDQVIRFRQWMKAHGQQNKPLINSEYGILLPVDYGYDYPRVIAFLVNSFDLFNTLRDTNLGYPEDDYRLMQRWCWFSLDSDDFEGNIVRSLFDRTRRTITPLGQAFAGWATSHRTPYVDFVVSETPVYTPTWAIFQGQPSSITLGAKVTNQGNTATGPFDVRFGIGGPNAGGPVIGINTIPTGLPPRWSPAAYTEVNWQVVFGSATSIHAKADPNNAIPEFSETNNSKNVTVNPVNLLDIAVRSLRADAPDWTTIAPGEPFTTTLRVAVRNRGSIGVSGDLTVQFWLGPPSGGGTLLGDVVINAQNSPTVPLEVTLPWTNVMQGTYELYAYVAPPAGDTDPNNNLVSTTAYLWPPRMYFPHVER